MARESEVEDSSEKQGRECCDARLNDSENNDGWQNYTKSDDDTEQNNNQNNGT
jgi:hypothetical protein